ncbi:MAG: ATP-binding protein, partial [Dietzia sp.]|nr:ATP-binding protein [Dietzia sp.]
MFTAALHDDHGAVTGTMGVIEDITQRRAARQELERYRDHLEELVDERTVELRRSNDALLQATEAKETFLASMSHELRTPLNSIIGFSGIMLQGLAGPLNEEQGKQLKMVNLAGHHLLALINDVLDLVKIESGRTAPNVEVVRISEVLESVEGILRPLADEKHLELRTVLGSDICLVTDRRRLEQILLNLLSNAVKFTARGFVSLSVSSDEEAIRFEVVDTGVGVDREALESIFDEFFQIELPEKLRPEGTGLGLAISRRLAGLLGGRVFATSEVGVGSTFTLELPVSVAASAPVPAEPHSEQCSVLVVDDDSHARAIVSVVLRAEGYRVIEAVDGEHALEVIAVDRPDCIVLDLVMPRLDG